MYTEFVEPSYKVILLLLRVYTRLWRGVSDFGCIYKSFICVILVYTTHNIYYKCVSEQSIYKYVSEIYYSRNWVDFYYHIIIKKVQMFGSEHYCSQVLSLAQSWMISNGIGFLVFLTSIEHSPLQTCGAAYLAGGWHRGATWQTTLTVKLLLELQHLGHGFSPPSGISGRSWTLLWSQTRMCHTSENGLNDYILNIPSNSLLTCGFKVGLLEGLFSTRSLGDWLADFCSIRKYALTCQEGELQLVHLSWLFRNWFFLALWFDE